MSEVDDKREQINYISVDSAPKRFAGPVSEWQAPRMLLLFTVLAMFQLWAVNTEFAGGILRTPCDFDPYFSDLVLYIVRCVQQWWLSWSRPVRVGYDIDLSRWLRRF